MTKYISGNRTAEDVLRAYHQKLEEQKNKTPRQEPRKVAPAKINADTKDLENYVLIPETNTLTAKHQTHNGLNWEQTHYKLAEEGLFMPSPALFMAYFLKTKEASEGNLTLYDGKNQQISKAEANELWNDISSTDRKNREDCWIWLDAKFVQGSGCNNLDIETAHSVASGKLISKKTEPLEACLNKDCYANLVFNKQGLPIEESTDTKYKQNKNLRFWHPRKDAVAWFDAYSGRAVLICDDEPQYSYSALGVRPCVELKKKV
jgi:hypothetical protein